MVRSAGLVWTITNILFLGATILTATGLWLVP
jgi:hypothetical protein